MLYLIFTLLSCFLLFFSLLTVQHMVKSTLIIITQLRRGEIFVWTRLRRPKAVLQSEEWLFASAFPQTSVRGIISIWRVSHRLGPHWAWAHVSAYYPECYTVQLTHFTFCVSRLDLAKLSTFVLSIRAHVRLIIMCCARGPRGRPVSRPGRSVAERCTAKLKCITAALSCCCHVWAIVENFYITRKPAVSGAAAWTPPFLSSEYQPSPLAALGSVCGPQPSGTAHRLHKEKEGDGKETREEHSTTQAFLWH